MIFAEDRFMSADLESAACKPCPVAATGFNPDAVLPYGCTVNHIQKAMADFIDFLGFINAQVHTKGIPRIESMLMPANFSSMVGEFMAANIPKYCPGVVKNKYHNGHPDLIPSGKFPDDAVQHSAEGIEIKASRYESGWQGHNPENVFLLVFVFDSNRSSDATKKANPRPFRFVEVLGAQISKKDWVFSGRSGKSRRTITASVTNSGYRKMRKNWIYRSPD